MDDNWQHPGPIMMGRQNEQPGLFTYRISLEGRVRANHPLRRVAALVDFAFVRGEVAHCYGRNGNESVDPEVLLKMMFLLFFENIQSERELMAIIAERLDYLWFLGYEIDQEIPNHSVLSKARTRWGKELFEKVFTRSVWQCVQAGLVDGTKIHLDASLIEANASKDSVLKGPPELIAALKQAYAATESKLEETTTPAGYEAVNDRLMSTTDPDAAVVRRNGDSRPRYHHHRAVDDAHGVITAVETTPGSIAENKKLLDLVDQHATNTKLRAETVVADHKYGTHENYVACQQRGMITHMGDAAKGQDHHRRQGIFPDSAFLYDPVSDSYRCPAGELLRPRRLHPTRRTMEYIARGGICARCALRSQCTRASYGRTVKRHEHEELLNRARGQAHSRAARRDRKRRQHLIEGSFADAANNHHFKRARWRRLWRQQIQDYLIAAIQNIRILLRQSAKRPGAAIATAGLELTNQRSRLYRDYCPIIRPSPSQFATLAQICASDPLIA